MDFIFGKYTFVIKQIEVEGRTIFHMAVRPPMSDEEYDDIKYRIERMGGHWRERFGGFIFTENPLSSLRNPNTWEPIIRSEYDEWKISRQFYPTPAPLAEMVCSLAEIQSDSLVLEPSAGHGALLEPIKECSGIITVEIDKANADILRNKGYKTYNMSFEEAVKELPMVDRVVMNPPFSGQRDIKHIMAAYKLLKPGGILVGIMAENDLYWKTALTHAFNAFLQRTGAEVHEVPMRSFLDTSVDVVIVKIKKTGLV